MLRHGLLLCLILAFSPAIRAYAVFPSVSLVFTETSGSGATGNSAITAAPGDLLTLEIRVSPGSDFCCGYVDGISHYAIAIRFDLDLANELDLIDATAFAPEGWLGPFEFVPRESSLTTTGFAGSFGADDFQTGVGFPSGDFFTVGIVRFRVNSGVRSDHADIVSVGGGLQGAWFCDGGGLCPVNGGDLGTASVDLAPDSDSDGVVDADDLCPDFGTVSNTDLDANGIGDPCECGDQNGDGTVDVRDLVAINAAIFDPTKASPLCDTDFDGLCNVSDIVGASRKIFGQPSYCSRYPPP